MNDLYLRALRSSVSGLIIFSVLIFLPAWTFDYWQAWLFLGVFTACTTCYTVYLARYNKPLLERRMNAGPMHEKETSQKIIMSLAGLCFVLLIALSSLDHRYGLSLVPAYVSIFGNAVIAASFVFIFWVTNVNSFAAANIDTESDQKVIDAGPYAHVRHPMYAGAFWMLLAIPLALGSWHGVLLNIPFMPVLIWRLLDEERILVRDLPGYSVYMQKIRYRLIPYIW